MRTSTRRAITPHSSPPTKFADAHLARHRSVARLASFALTAGTLAIVQAKVALPLLLLERFVPGLGWLQVAAMAAYASWIAGPLLDPRRQPRWRRWLWLGFSLVFFVQLGLGLLGVERMLMTGQLHLPVPALIAAGPIYRGEGLFMPILFVATVVLVGPAWCSHLCYIGSWDHEAARRRRRPGRLTGSAPVVRVALAAAVIAAALAFRWLGIASALAAAVAGAFGAVGIVVMLVGSRRTGVMTHCVVYCPMGLVADVLGKISPFRLRIGAPCDGCGVCERTCRFDALRPEHIARRRPGISCTLCGDCVRSCRHRAIELTFPGLSPRAARTAFVVLVASLHATFVACARL